MIWRRHLYLDRGGCVPLTPIYPSLQLFELCKGSRFQVFQIRGVTVVQEDLDPFVYPVHDVHPDETVSCEALAVLKLEVINVTRPCHH